jgi:hypothetical protein
MLVPYVHIARRWFLHRYLGATNRWLQWHVAAAYLAFFFLVIHTRGRASGGLTMALQILTWVVMVSGVVGYYGQKMLYVYLPRLIPHEFGRERLGPQRELLQDEAEKQLKEGLAACTGDIRLFCELAMTRCLARPLGSWSLFRRWQSEVSEELLLRSLEDARDREDAVRLRKLWELVKQRQQLDLEYRFHYLGRLWLLFHGPAAWALLVLIVEHVWVSIRYGGF